MSMFDDVRSSYPGLTGFFQTKDLDCFMWFLYLDPSGRLWRIDYSGTQTFVYIPETPFRPIPNGNHGRVVPLYVNGDVTISTDKTTPDGYVESFDYKLTFVDGVLRSYSVL